MALPHSVVAASVKAATNCRPPDRARGYLRVELDPQTHKQFRLWAAKQGVSMTQLATRIIEDAIFAGAPVLPNS